MKYFIYLFFFPNCGTWRNAEGYQHTPKAAYKDSGLIKGSPFPFPCVREHKGYSFGCILFKLRQQNNQGTYTDSLQLHRILDVFFSCLCFANPSMTKGWMCPRCSWVTTVAALLRATTAALVLSQLVYMPCSVQHVHAEVACTFLRYVGCWSVRLCRTVNAWLGLRKGRCGGDDCADTVYVTAYRKGTFDPNAP